MTEATAQPRSWRSSLTTMTQLVFPEHANALGKAFGGQVMAWADLCGGICSMRHVGGLTVTAAVDDLVFERAINLGDVVTITGRVNAAFGSSIEVEVKVEGETLATGARWLCVTALMTFVAIDGSGRPRPAPPVLLEDEESKERAEAALRRRTERLQKREVSKAPKPSGAGPA